MTQILPINIYSHIFDIQKIHCATPLKAVYIFVFSIFQGTNIKIRDLITLDICPFRHLSSVINLRLVLFVLILIQIIFFTLNKCHYNPTVKKYLCLLNSKLEIMCIEYLQIL